MVSRVTPLLLGGADGDRGLLKVDSNASPQRLMFFPFFKCPKWLKDDEENEEENASNEQDSRGSSLDVESSSDDNNESKEDGKVAAVTAEDGHQLSAYELQRLNASDAARRRI